MDGTEAILLITKDKTEASRATHIKASQLHCTDGLDLLIEWMEWESHRRWNESNELPDFTEILTKAKEIKSSLNK